MKIDCVIPTRNRREKLQVAINSILRTAKSDNIRLVIYFSDEAEITHWRQYLDNIPNISLNYLPEYNVPHFWNSYLHDMTADAMCYLNDDIELLEDTLDIIQYEFPRRFPDYDGIMGLNQINIEDGCKVESAFGVIGRKYAERFPFKQVICPDYYRFYSDYEMWLFASQINRFYFCKEAKLFHYHPSLNPKWTDDTHVVVRQWLPKDRATFKARQQQGLLWGKSYRLINQE